MKYVVLEKAKPYTRVRQGKFERVKGYPGMTVYHGTRPSKSKIILKEGFKSSEKGKHFGISFALDPESALYWGKRGGVVGNPSVLKVAVNVKNPYVVENFQEYQDYVTSVEQYVTGDKRKNISFAEAEERFLKENGFDALLIKDFKDLETLSDRMRFGIGIGGPQLITFPENVDRVEG